MVLFGLAVVSWQLTMAATGRLTDELSVVTGLVMVFAAGIMVTLAQEKARMDSLIKEVSELFSERLSKQSMPPDEVPGLDMGIGYESIVQDLESVTFDREFLSRNDAEEFWERLHDKVGERIRVTHPEVPDEMVQDITEYMVIVYLHVYLMEKVGKRPSEVFFE